jgi:hypothetical protein
MRELQVWTLDMDLENALYSPDLGNSWDKTNMGWAFSGYIAQGCAAKAIIGKDTLV